MKSQLALNPNAREQVNHKINTSLRMFINRFHGDFPPHWHTDIEIIMPKEAPYRVICANQTYNVEIGDILTLWYNGTKIVLCHYPLAEWDGMYRCALDFFGHIHNNENNAQKIMRDVKGAYNISAELLGYKPKTIEEIIGTGERGIFCQWA